MIYSGKQIKYLIVLILMIALRAYSQQILVSGRVLDAENRTPLIGCNISVDSTRLGTATDTLGLFALYLKPGKYRLVFNYLGYHADTLSVELNSSQTVVRRIVFLKSANLFAPEQLVLGSAVDSMENVQLLQKRDIENMPVLYGDVLRGIKMLPGVASNNETTTKYFVRGGNHNENLIYLNGVEIYQPHLLKTGIEQNLSIINPELTGSMAFYAGGFSVQYGDKLSSALAVEYEIPSREKRVKLKTSLLNSSLTFWNGERKFRYAISGRYSQPTVFLKRLQTLGDYTPKYSDAQLVFQYPYRNNSAVEGLVIWAKNDFRLEPTEWVGNFKYSIIDVRGVKAVYDGQRNFTADLLISALRWSRFFNPYLKLSARLSHIRSDEREGSHLNSDIFYVPDARSPDWNNQYLMERREFADNRFEYHNSEAEVVLQKLGSSLVWTNGLFFRISRQKMLLNESFVEAGEDVITQLPEILYRTGQRIYSRLGMYSNLQMIPNEKLQVQAGLRAVREDESATILVSPRGRLTIKPRRDWAFSFSAGLYQQFPGFYEWRDMGHLPAPQKAIHYVAGLKVLPSPYIQGSVEWYYKDYRSIYPFYLKNGRMRYWSDSVYQGYATGVDVRISGKIIPGAKSWISYSYLDTKERPKFQPGGYYERPLSQKHTFNLFLQDELPGFPQCRAHAKIGYGSGFTFYQPRTKRGAAGGPVYYQPDFSQRENYRFYARVDMGLTFLLVINQRVRGKLKTEVQNVFDNRNIIEYEWFQPFKDIEGLVRVPQLLTRRFFNMELELEF
ncbi:MAG: TonB-dependent receptor [Calditrichia bacterium]